ncbi:UNVERIFIED_CONTAM: hypothetical protein HDU68_004553 [Siphonaria sp. JEL0065]|nr:hypothetical protein HDU68_004553 [Siphonaria sp. JEL0065]
MQYPDDFLRRIPKTDLHCHLDGSIRLQTLIDLSKEQGLELPAYDVEGLKKLVFKPHYNSLEEYLECFKYSSAALAGNGDGLERVAYELALDQFAIGVRYFEVRFAPQIHATPGVLSIDECISKVNEGLQRGVQEYNSRPEIITGEEPEYNCGIIVCAMRCFSRDSSPWYKNFWDCHQHETPKRIYGLASVALVAAAGKLRNSMGIPIVAVDIAGAEFGFPASDHKEAFELAHKKFFFKTIHAGEGYGPESIFQAITDCHAERIGHGYHLFAAEQFSNTERTPESREAYIAKLIQYMSNMRICIEVCLSSNLQTIPQSSLDQHPAKRMLDRKMAITICSDNMTVSHTDVYKELKLAVDAFQLTPQQVKDITMTGFKRSFMAKDYVEKRSYNRRIVYFYERMEKEYGVHTHKREESFFA